MRRVRAVSGRALLLALVLFGAACDRSSAPEEAIANVRLGMAPRDVRARFQPGADGAWQTAVGTGDDTIIAWTSSDEGSAVKEVRFEFHLGMLVAIRARTSKKTAAESIATTARTVTVRAPADEGGTVVTVLARDCPTHKDEAEAFVARAPR